MINGKTVLAIIPARGGSKRIPNKNIKILGNKPLIAWTIEIALESKLIDSTIVNTDDAKIMKISNQYQADVPFLRKSELATDSATSIDMLLDTLQWFEEYKKSYDYFILLQPTSPLRTKTHIDEALTAFEANSNATSLVSVVQLNYDILKTRYIKKTDGYLGMLELTNVQDLDELTNNQYRINGAIYISKWDTFIQNKSFFRGNYLPYKMGEVDSIDIDTFDDWERAEYQINKKSEYNL